MREGFESKSAFDACAGEGGWCCR